MFLHVCSLHGIKHVVLCQTSLIQIVILVKYSTKRYYEECCMNAITCPACGEQFEVTEALKDQLQKKVLLEIKEKHEKQLEDVKLAAFNESHKKLKDQFESQVKQIQIDSTEKDTRNKELIEQITNLTKELRLLKRESDETRLEMEKKLAQEEEKIRLDARKKAQEEQHTKIMEKEKQLSDALKEIEEMKRKLQQGSQQMQGEVFELEFEEMLAKEFPNDKIQPVAKGVRGGDVIQEVWDSRGNYNGKILWELKNTKPPWKEEWVIKLKNDQRGIKAEDAVLVSEVLPKHIKTAGFQNGIWVTSRVSVMGIACALRAKLIQIYYIKASTKGKNEKIEVLYSYLSGTEFKHRVEAIVEAFTNMQTEIEKEKRYFVNKWARDEKNIRQVVDNTYGMHGDLKGIIGTTLPEIKGLDMIELQGDGATLQDT